MPRPDPSVPLSQAIRHLNAGRVAEAHRLCSEVVQRHRNNHQALAILGQIASMSSRHQEAARLLSRCVSLAPAEIDYHVLLAEVLATQGRHREALARYDRALKLRGDYGPALAGTANVLVRTGQWDQARALLEPLVAAGSEDAGTALVYTRVARHDGAYDRAVEIALRHVDDPVSAEIRRALWFDIGRAYEAAERYDEAFAAFTTANRKGGGRWDPVVSSEHHDHIIEVFTAETFQQLPPGGNRSQLPVFIVGMPRSGSTLIEQIIASHPQAFGAGEILTLPDLVSTLGQRIGSTGVYPRCVRDLERSDADTLGKAYLDEIRKLAPAAARVCDKQLGNYEHLGLIRMLLPAARIIHARRDPMDTCLSCFVQKFAPAVPGYSEDLRHLGMLYNDYLAMMAHWRRVLDVEILEVDYEALVDDPEATSRRIIEFCGLPWHDRCLRFWESGRTVITLSRDQVTRPVYRSSVGRHERYAAHLEPLREVLERGLRGNT